MLTRTIPYLLALLPILAQAQEKGYVRLMVEPGHNFVVQVDGTSMVGKLLELPEGSHSLRLWAPGRMVVDTTVVVKPRESIDVVARLPHDPAFLAYQQEQLVYTRRKRAIRMLPLVATAGSLTYSGFALSKWSGTAQNLQDDRDRYDRANVPSEITRLKEQTMVEHQKEFRQARTNFIVSASATALLAGTTWWAFRKSARWNRPEFQDEQRLRFEGVAYVPMPQGGQVVASLIIPIR